MIVILLILYTFSMIANFVICASEEFECGFVILSLIFIPILNTCFTFYWLIKNINILKFFDNFKDDIRKIKGM